MLATRAGKPNKGYKRSEDPSLRITHTQTHTHDTQRERVHTHRTLFNTIIRIVLQTIFESFYQKPNYLSTPYTLNHFFSTHIL